ncbi:hypothetical protein SL1157_1640 [Ruegeria lacuscaerulensis ITI-1157]|nr:hypothetical protein SL1157_1640 [Ruegeria lacuscaerulensis ITI-1157]SHK04655.1 hypothetical protein SAMN05444404_3173 [Ruegeria lacuscaerulensis ITI-1157]
MDPRKPIIRPDKEAQDAARQVAYDYLTAATIGGAKAIGCTGASFVIIGISLWLAELDELDPRATSQMLHALSVLHDPKANPTQKARAERRRKAAVDKLFAAVDLMMNPAEGKA